MRRDTRDPLTSQARSISRAGSDPVRLMMFAWRYLGDAVAPIHLEVYPLRGGLEAAGVFWVQVCSGSASSRRRTASFVVKRVSGRGRREVRAYETLLRRSNAVVAPRLLGTESMGPTTAYLYLEWMAPWVRWPWRELQLAAFVLERMAYVHACLPADAFATDLADWNFEAELLQSAWKTLELLETVARQEEFAAVRRALPTVRRVVAALPALRRHLVAAERTATVLHGNAHSGNVMRRRRGTAREVVLFDWGRTRLGSPLEDVSSWLQSLG